jgi:hypothetical protein
VGRHDATILREGTLPKKEQLPFTGRSMPSGRGTPRDATRETRGKQSVERSMGRIGAGICVRTQVGEGKEERREAGGVVAVDACSPRVLLRYPGCSNRETWQGGGRAGVHHCLISR